MSANDSYFPRQQPVGLSMNGNLSSNNPFRNRTTLPASSDPLFASLTPSPFDDPSPPPRPVSRNPFLDQVPAHGRPADNIPNRSNTRSLTAEDIFGSLTLDDRGINNYNKSNNNSSSSSNNKNKDNNKNQLIDFESADSPSPPPQQQQKQLRPAPQRLASNIHRPTLSQEEALRARKPQSAISKATPAVESPQGQPQRRPRRNSDSSLMDFDSRQISTKTKATAAAAAATTDAKRRDADQRRRGDSRDKTRTGRPSRKMDIIDQLDATSIYGTGLFHHDGPFDALNPHRNRQNGRRLAPMQAFPKDSLNNTIGGAGPLNPRADHSEFMGLGTEEAFNDFATSGKKSSYGMSSSRETAIFDPVSRGTAVHGDESYGLGTSTFLEGTPAARSAIIRREAEHQQEVAEGGLQRKKSLAQRVRQIGKGPREHNPSGRSVDHSRFGSSLGSEGGPYHSEMNPGDESVDIEKGSRNGRSAAAEPMIRRRGSRNALEGQLTVDTTAGITGGPAGSTPGGAAGSAGSGEETTAKPLGLLGRMKSLKGGRRPNRNETP